ILENILPSVSPTHHMIGRSLKLDSYLPRHPCIFLAPGVKMQEKRTDPKFHERLEREPEATKSNSKSRRTVEELETENRQLRAENAKLLEQREVLKKSLGILSEVPPSGMPGSNR